MTSEEWTLDRPPIAGDIVKLWMRRPFAGFFTYEFFEVESVGLEPSSVLRLELPVYYLRDLKTRAVVKLYKIFFEPVLPVC